MASTFPCPACGFLVFDEPAGSYAVCPVCAWEDDEVQLRFLGYRGGANAESLCEHQQAWLTTVPVDCQIHKGFRRSSEWRPLLPEECVEDVDCREPHIYYWRRAGA